MRLTSILKVFHECNLVYLRKPSMKGRTFRAPIRGPNNTSSGAWALRVRVEQTSYSFLDRDCFRYSRRQCVYPSRTLLYGENCWFAPAGCVQPGYVIDVGISDPQRLATVPAPGAVLGRSRDSWWSCSGTILPPAENNAIPSGNEAAACQCPRQKGTSRTIRLCSQPLMQALVETVRRSQQRRSSR